MIMFVILLYKQEKWWKWISCSVFDVLIFAKVKMEHLELQMGKFFGKLVTQIYVKY